VNQEFATIPVEKTLSHQIFPLLLKVAIYLLPLWWYGLMVFVLSRLAHLLNDKLFLAGGLSVCLTFGIPVLFLLIAICTNLWFRKNALKILLMWTLLPALSNQVGLT